MSAAVTVLWPMRLIGTAIVLLILVIATASMVRTFFTQTSSATTIISGPIERISASTTAGRVRVEISPPGQPVRVTTTRHWAFRAATTQVVRDKNALRISGNCRGAWWLSDSCSIDIDVVVPPGVTLDLTTSAGSILVLGGGATAATPTIRATAAAGSVDLRDMFALEVNADVSAGAIRLTFAVPPRSVRAHTSTGDIRVAVPVSGITYHVDATSSVGSTKVDIPDDPSSTRVIDATSSVGSVTIVPR